jgi:hypothetical protein
MNGAVQGVATTVAVRPETKELTNPARGGSRRDAREPAPGSKTPHRLQAIRSMRPERKRHDGWRLQLEAPAQGRSAGAQTRRMPASARRKRTTPAT